MENKQIKIEEIPADKLFQMTDFWHRAFNAAGCDPMCHCCQTKIGVKKDFKLATVKKPSENAFDKSEIKSLIKLLHGFIKSFKVWEGWDREREVTLISHEVMLCDICTSEMFMAKQIKIGEEELNRLNKAKGGCFRINGKIVH